LRALAEGQVRELRRLVVEFASAFVAEELDARRRADPRFVERATPADWRQLLRAARQAQTECGRWAAARRAADEPARWQAEADRLRGEVDRLTAELARRAVAAPPASLDIKLPPRPEAVDAVPVAPALAAPIRPPSPVKPGLGATVLTVPEPLGLAEVRLPGLPPVAPARFAGQLQAWPREALALAILAATGWSMRLAVADQMSAALGSVKASAGSLRRTFSLLAKRGYWLERKVVLTGVHTPLPNPAAMEDDATEDARDPGENTVLVHVRLGDLGRDLLGACGIQPEPSEWDLLEAACGSQAAVEYLGLVCAFTYQARLRGYATALAPRASNPARDKPCPAVLLRHGDETLQVAICRGVESGELWPDHGPPHEQVALAALTPEQRDELVAQVRSAGFAHGRATDLQTLFNTQAVPGTLWPVAW
jgi:hypothetical protein